MVRKIIPYIAEAAGLALIVAAGWLVDERIGLALAGLALLNYSVRRS